MMEKSEFRGNYILSLLEFILFLVLLCFMVEATDTFIETLSGHDNFKLWVLFLGGAFPLLIYTFIAELNGVYEKIQYFFFRHSVFNLLVPSVLLLLAIAYFIVPKLFSITFNRDIYVFFGGFAAMAHLTFIATQTKGSGFTGVVHYLFLFSLLYILTLFLLSLYMAVGFAIDLGALGFDSLKEGFLLAKSIFTQLAP